MTRAAIEPFSAQSVQPGVRGFLHRPARPSGDGIVLTHGAGSNCQSPLLVSVAEAFAECGLMVLRCDLSFREVRPQGPPTRGDAERDREGICRALAALRPYLSGRIFLGGHSYGGRQASMLCASDPGQAATLLLLSYPLHPPRKPEQMRTEHFPQLQTPVLFVHGTRDPFGSPEEMDASLDLIPARHALLTVEQAGHDLGFRGSRTKITLPGEVVVAFAKLSGLSAAQGG